MVLFGLGSLVLALISRKSLLKPRTHGFYRFFAWEAILGLVLLNGASWLKEAFGWHQIVSWILLTLSLIPLVLGIIQLKQAGRAGSAERGEPELFPFEKTTELVQSGIFGLIRHPLYSSLLLLAWGFFFKDPTALGAILGIGASALLILTARADEAECLQTFGNAYRGYMRRTRMFIPYLL